MAIDVGSSATDRATVSSAQTYVDLDNPANATGLIMEISVYCNVELEGIKVASFFNTGGANFSTRGNVLLANASIGLNTYTAPASFAPFEIRTGDYIGIYFSAGEIDADTGGIGYYYKSGDNIPCTEEEFTVSPAGNIRHSLYATGYQLGQINIGDSWKDIQNIQINVGDVWKQLSNLQINISDVWKSGLT